MRHLIILLSLTFSLVSSVVFAADNSKLMNGNAEYSNENYDKAIELYEELLKENESAAAYYNLGNAYYKKGQLANAILNYERAYLRDPNDPDIKSNLELARLQTVDKIEHVDKFVMTEWLENLENSASSNAWARWSVFFLIFSVCGLSAYMFVPVNVVRKLGFVLSVISFLLFVPSLCFARSSKNKIVKHDYAIIFTPSVTVKASPEKNAKDYFMLHEGTKVHIRQKMQQWMEIELEDGNVGWILDSDAKVI